MKVSKLILLIVLISATTTSGFEVIALLGGPASAPTRWNSAAFPIGYSIHNGGTQGISASAVSTQYNKVIKQINKQSPLKFKNNGITSSSVTSGDGQNGVFFDKNFQFGSFPIAVQALRGNPTNYSEGDLFFNDRDYNFSVTKSNPQANVFQVFSIMLHEMGHGAGLNHTLDKRMVMFFQALQDFKVLGSDDKAGIKFIYQNTVFGNLPVLVTPINQSIQNSSSVGATARLITFRWTKSQSAARSNGQTAAAFTLVFAADSGFTKNITKFNASSKEAFLIKGAKLNKLKKIQQASATQQIFWRVEENNGGQVLKSAPFSFKIL